MRCSIAWNMSLPAPSAEFVGFFTEIMGISPLCPVFITVVMAGAHWHWHNPALQEESTCPKPPQI